MTDALLWITTALLLGTTVWRARRAIDVPLLVPLAWLAIIPLPAILRGGALGFRGEPRDNLFLSIAIANIGWVGLQLFVDSPVFSRIRRGLVAWVGPAPQAEADFRGRIGKGPEHFSLSVAGREGSGVVYWFAGILAVSLTLAVWHLALMPRIPALEVLRGVTDPAALAQAREDSAKLLPVPALVNYAFNWNGHMLLPILLCTAVLLRWRLLAATIAVCGLLYVMAPLAKSPSMLFVLSPFVAVAIRDRRRLWSPLLIAGLLLSLIPPLLIAQGPEIASTVRSQLGISAPVASGGPSAQPVPSPGPGVTVTGSAHHLVDLVLRRIGTGQVDVAYSWFAYFPAHHGFLHGSGWEPWKVLSANYQSPANLVGLWAYYGRPNYPLTSLRAYATFIADGWAEFGFLGVLLATVILLGICSGVEVMRGFAGRPFCLACYAPALVLLSATVSQSGILAILFSLGTFLSPLIAAAYLVSTRRANRAPTQPLATRQPSLSG